MRITINGETYRFETALTVRQLLAQLELDPEKIAVERNLEIVPCSEFEQTRLAEEDALEIIHFIGGG